ncbi:ribosomal protein S18-alanine N-acetyltransferase [Haloplanus halobius]|uniref:ribosomal protein S18-alanine N-acetyltransferase n=1 Tax=Haloplanus halobius TaxID=2934938 RepID=UPI00201035CD
MDGPTPPANVTIREARQSDLSSVVRIERDSFGQPWPYTAFERFLDDPGFLVAARDGGVVGYVVGDVTPNFGRDIGHIKDLAVAPPARRHGIGRALLVRSLVTLAVDGAQLVKLEVREGNDAAQALYRDIGFETARRVSQYYRDGEDALVMVLDVHAWRENDGS